MRADPVAANKPARTDLARIVDKLPPTQYLILDVLGARHRLGESTWTFQSRIAPALRLLEDAGLIWWKFGPVQNTCLAGLTDNGRTGVLSTTYVPPADTELVDLRAENATLTRLLLKFGHTAC